MCRQTGETVPDNLANLLTAEPQTILTVIFIDVNWVLMTSRVASPATVSQPGSETIFI